MEAPTYTFHFNFGGKLYISQVQAESLYEVMLAWGHALDGNVVRCMSDDVKQDLLNDLQDEYAVAIDETINVWGFVVAPLRMFGHVYFVKAAEPCVGSGAAQAQTAMYTFIMNYMGGGYISQVHADSVHEAVVAWARNLEVNEIGNMDERIRGILLKKLRSVYPNAVVGVSNAWSFTIAP